VPVPCPVGDKACLEKAPISGMHLVDHPDPMYAPFKGVTTGRCGKNPDAEEITENQDQINIRRDTTMKNFAKELADEKD